MPTLPVTLTLSEAAAYLCLHPRTLRRAIAAGHLATTRQEIGTGRFRHLVEREELERAVAAGILTPGRRPNELGSLALPDRTPGALVGDDAVTLHARADRAEVEVHELRDRLRAAEEREAWLQELVNRLTAPALPAPAAPGAPPPRRRWWRPWGAA